MRYLRAILPLLMLFSTQHTSLSEPLPPLKSKEFNEPPRNQLIAHRGLLRRAPENTLLAFELAKKDGFDFLELDIMPSADDEFFVFHDYDLHRLGIKKTLCKIDTSQIKEAVPAKQF